MPRHRLVALLMAGAVAALAPATAIQAQDTEPAEGPRTIFDGVYTDAQAERGKKLYVEYCSVCHGGRGGGGPAAPALTGSTMDDKEGMTLADLVDFMIQVMPPDDPGRLRTREYIDVTAFILSLHGAPAGETELPGKLDDLTGIEIVATPAAGDAAAAPAPTAAPAPAPAPAAPAVKNDGH